MHAVIFDIDGTLIESMEADGALFHDAIRSVLGPVKLRGSWSCYRHVTNRGVLDEICSDNGVIAEPGIIRRVRSAFVEGIRQHIERSGPFREIPGAKDFLSALAASPGHAVAYATGCWSDTARLKLSSAGFPLAGVPLSSSDDHMERSRIMMRALDSLGTTFDSITYYGDGKWDRAAAEELRWQFVAVGKALDGITEYHAVGV